MIDNLTLGAPNFWAASLSSGDGAETGCGLKSPFDERKETGGSEERSKGASRGIYLNMFMFLQPRPE